MKNTYRGRTIVRVVRDVTYSTGRLTDEGTLSDRRVKHSQHQRAAEPKQEWPFMMSMAVGVMIPNLQWPVFVASPGNQLKTVSSFCQKRCTHVETSLTWRVDKTVGNCGMREMWNQNDERIMEVATTSSITHNNWNCLQQTRWPGEYLMGRLTTGPGIYPCNRTTVAGNYSISIPE